jgi:aminoglycoside phosphotransferase (APT) family kinase protein
LSNEYNRIATLIETLIFALHEVKPLPSGASGRVAAFLARAGGWETESYSKRDNRSSSMTEETLSGGLDQMAGEMQRFLGQKSLLKDTEYVASIDQVAGGFSKSTFIVYVENSKKDRRRLVMRRNEPEPLLTDACFRLENEFQILRVLHAKGILVPRPHVYEPANGNLGGDFILMEFAPGSIYGTVVERQSTLPESTFIELAYELARLHQLPLDALGASATTIFGRAALNQSIAQRNLALQRENLHYWLAKRSEPSPVAARAFAWLLDHVPRNESRPALIHGDLGLHNVLVEGGKLSAILDWESAQVGDPAQDLSSLRDIVTAHMDWTRFLSAYHSAGGPIVDEASLRFHALSRNLRSICIIAAAGAMFEDAKFDDIKAAALKTAFMPIFIAQTSAITDQLAGKPT